MSASSWGCELKYVLRICSNSEPESASSWGCELKFRCNINKDNVHSQPLREAVSWNIASATGTEGSTVSLFVRLWVEINPVICLSRITSSASSWGCELKYHEVRQKKRSPGQPLREAVSWNVNHINCFIRKKSQPLREAVSWNDICFMRRTVPSSQPLREAVSWNVGADCSGEKICVSLFVRLWVEMNPYKGWPTLLSQPLREAVSWNSVHPCGITPNLSSASSWGCELK